MRRPLATLGICLLLVTVLSVGAPVVSGDAFSDPLIYDWLNNNTNDEESHVSDYGIRTPEQYFSGGLSGPQEIENTLNESIEDDTTGEALYRVYDENYIEYPVDPVYTTWNRRNVNEYDRRQLIPEFKHKEVKNESGDSIYGLDAGQGEFMIQKGWTGMYSVQPSSYAHFFPPEEDEVLGTSKHVIGDEVTVFAVVGGERAMTPDNRRDGSLSSVGTKRYRYSFDSLTRRAVLVIDSESGRCTGGCVAAETSVSGNVAEFENVQIAEFVEPGTEFELITRGIVQVAFSEDVDRRVERTREVSCPEPDDPNETVNPPCYEDYMTWTDYDENTVTEQVQTSDRQSFLYPAGLNDDNIDDDIVYERANYPNGTVEVHIDMSSADGTLTDTPVWRRIEVGDEYVASPWRVWSSRNMSWDYMYESQGSEQELESHTRPLVFHTAPLRYGLSASDGLEFRKTRYTYSSFNPYLYGFGSSTSRSYDSPHLLRHKSCQAFWPEQDEETMFCGWWLTGSGNYVEDSQSAPYFSVEYQGQWQLDSELYMTVDGQPLEEQELRIYGLAPGDGKQIETDRYVDVRESELYAEVVDDNFDAGEDRAWVEVRFTLVDAEDNSRISTAERSGESITVENAVFDADGEHDEDDFQTNESGQVTVRVYDVKDEDITARYNAESWYDVSDGQRVYTQSSVDKTVVIPAFSMYDMIRYLVLIGWVLYITVYAGVKFFRVMGYREMSIEEEFRSIFPTDVWKVVLWSLVIFFILTITTWF